MESIYKVSNVLMESSDLKEIAEKILNYIFHLFRRIDRGFSFSSLFSPHLPTVQPLPSRMHALWKPGERRRGRGFAESIKISRHGVLIPIIQALVYKRVGIRTLLKGF
jgi:hypothetical protein